MKVAENSPQNARNCTILKKILGGACPQTPLAKARSFAARDMPLRGMYIQNPRNFKVGPPPLTNPAYAPGLRGRFYFTRPTHSQMDFKLQTTTQSGRTIFQSTQAHWVWVDK